MEVTDILRTEIIADIDRCDAQDSRNGSEALYNELISKYTVLDASFRDGLPKSGKIGTIGMEFDYRPEVRAIASKLKMWLKIHQVHGKEGTNMLRDKVFEFIERGKEIKVSEFHPADPGGFFLSYIAGPKFDAWMAEIHTFSMRHLKEHPLHNDIEKTYSGYKKNESSCDEMLALLQALSTDEEFFVGISAPKATVGENVQQVSNRVFIVHGHDDVAKIELARTLETLGLKAIILHEQPNEGRTIIEKIEANTDVAFGIVLYTECDIGRAKEDGEDKNQFRARQNVVFEHGYLIGKLGRSHVCALVKGEIELPGDISGVVYTPMDSKGVWKFELAKEMRQSGLNIDANKLL